ncbi:hypothetical protein EV356DRAFT_449147 [Viridothelium virens]|uniref:E3 ubiquitin-protein ligase n=1 Tax=Viridothelium virens TaxID=1048519 RepID=A0A6A6H585_VIRVR|nr:hypothetical protein EV356DRAFT_449147 [Viridothelium virens]
MLVSEADGRLCLSLRSLPSLFHSRYSIHVDQYLRQLLFQSLASPEYLPLLFPSGVPNEVPIPPPDTGESTKLQDPSTWNLREAQGAKTGAEYTEAARGHPCGHIFKTGEATYRCKTCSSDETCVLCAKCFDASDHEGHMVFVSTSPGNSGCCDCGDPEAWNRPVFCNIHSIREGDRGTSTWKGKGREEKELPEDLKQSIRITIARALDYLCDVFSCSPEQLRLPKTEESIREDERRSRLNTRWYGVGDNAQDGDVEFALILWNDEKHTVDDVRDQVARACRKRKSFGLQKATEVDDVGRSVVDYSKDLQELLRMAKVIEEIKVTVTIRSARDTFREQMCGTIIEWISDISGCTIGHDAQILRNTICEEMLQIWRMGSNASNVDIGMDGIDDHQTEDVDWESHRVSRMLGLHGHRPIVRVAVRTQDAEDSEQEENEDEDHDSDEDVVDQSMQGDSDDGGDQMEIDLLIDETRVAMGDDVDDMDLDVDLTTGASEATVAGYPPPPPPPATTTVNSSSTANTAQDDSDDGEIPTARTSAESFADVPKTPTFRSRPSRPPRPPKYWLEKPKGVVKDDQLPLREKLGSRVRLDSMILYDLRMWKRLRINLRDVYISTVVTIPYFKRILGLRFAGLYTTLAQLYLIADREPDHSIINLSLQMLTTPSITSEVVERGNFLTNLMAILYTFLTTRQVGYPRDVDPKATLAFDAGAVTNRRMYHFFLDLKYLFGSEYVQEKLAREDRYTLQFLDLVKLHQGICPNTRAVGEHIEYETDAWINASLVTREMNKLCRQFADSFKWARGHDPSNIQRAIRQVARAALVNSLGLERKRFDLAEIKNEVVFKSLKLFPFEHDTDKQHHKVVSFSVAKQPMSFHHAMHYLLSWLIDRGKSLPIEELKGSLLFAQREVKEEAPSVKAPIPDYQPDWYLLALFDFPLRVCAWLAQMRAGMWVRNGISLRHQMSTYRGISQRDVTHQRDIFLLQVALCVCDPTEFLASIIDRYDMTSWTYQKYDVGDDREDAQMIDVAEEFIHLLVVLLGDRNLLLPTEDEPASHIAVMKRDIAHILCSKRLSYSDLSNRLADKVQESDDFQDVLEEMTNYRPPEGVNDYGTFELKDEYLSEVDPYVAHYTRNQREEAENAYKSYVSRKTGKPIDEVVYEPKLKKIESGVFKNIAEFTRTRLFAQIVYSVLQYALDKLWMTKHTGIQATRVETFLHTVLHLVLMAVLEDDFETLSDRKGSFVRNTTADRGDGGLTIVAQLHKLSQMDEFPSCHPKVQLILRRMKQRQPVPFIQALSKVGVDADRMDTSSPAAPVEQDKEAKKKQALDRQARVMAQFKQQQNNFMENQSIDWGDENLSDLDSDFEVAPEEQEKVWKYPSGTCILCQEETNDQRLYGTFAYMMESNVHRQTDLKDKDFVTEVAETPADLDRSAEGLRPFGVARQNRKLVQKVKSDGNIITTERQGLGKGFPPGQQRKGPVTVGCGHIMHWTCFEMYVQATGRRHINQIARRHPEKLENKEFLCPMCKALGNCFLPILWKTQIEKYPGPLETQGNTSFDEWLTSQVAVQLSRLDKSPERPMEKSASIARYQSLFAEYGYSKFITPIASKLSEYSRTTPVPPLPTPNQPQPTGPFSRALIPTLMQTQNEDPRDPILSSTSQASGPVSSQPLGELLNAYTRLRETMRTNSNLLVRSSPVAVSPLEDLVFTETLSASLGFSIAAVEIAQRGIKSEGGISTETINHSTLTLLRVLSETVSSYLAIGGLRNQGLNKSIAELSEAHSRQLQQLFIGNDQLFRQGESITPEALFRRDIFVFLAECSVGIVPALRLDIYHILRLCYLAEIVKVVVAYLHEPTGILNSIPPIWESEKWEKFSNDAKAQCTGSQQAGFDVFVRMLLSDINSVASSTNLESAVKITKIEFGFLHRLRNLVSSYALTFLRKAAILMHVRFGVDFSLMPKTTTGNAAEPELSRLTKALRLPSMDDMFAGYTSQTVTGRTTRTIVGGWIRHWTYPPTSIGSTAPVVPLALPHPTIFELVGLPKNYDTLTDEAIWRKCPTTGRDMTDPCVCLFCGDIFCSQAVCCTKDDLGGANRHLYKCGGPIGLFINIRKCMLLFLNRPQGSTYGSWAPAPYLDKHGEADPTLRRHYQLFLNQKRYDKLLRDVWLGHQVPSLISRKLEMDINNGGWETL